jgi:hypothetical protein
MLWEKTISLKTIFGQTITINFEGQNTSIQPKPNIQNVQEAYIFI